MSFVNKPGFWIAVVAVGSALYLWLGDDTPAPVAKAKPKAKAALTSAVASDFDELDYQAKFDKPKPPARNVFLPLVVSGQGASGPAEQSDQDRMKIPADVADGDANWTYTGFAIIDGKRLAVLENSATHKSATIEEGKPWEKAKVNRITAQSIVFSAAGVSTVVMRYSPPVAKPSDAPSSPPPSPVVNNPMPVLSGPIGPMNPRNMAIVPNYSSFPSNVRIITK